MDNNNRYLLTYKLYDGLWFYEKDEEFTCNSAELENWATERIRKLVKNYENSLVLSSVEIWVKIPGEAEGPKFSRK